MEVRTVHHIQFSRVEKHRRQRIRNWHGPECGKYSAQQFGHGQRTQWTGQVGLFRSGPARHCVPAEVGGAGKIVARH